MVDQIVLDSKLPGVKKHQVPGHLRCPNPNGEKAMAGRFLTTSGLKRSGSNLDKD